MAVIPAARVLREISADGCNIPNLARADFGSGLLQSREDLIQLLMVFELGNRDVGADGPGFATRLDFVETGQGLDVDEDFRLGEVFLHLTEQINTAAEVAAIV